MIVWRIRGKIIRTVLHCNAIVHNHMLTDMSSTVLGFSFCVFLCFTGASLFVFGSVILCFVYFSFVIVWLSVPVQYDCLERLISEITCYVSSATLNPTQSLTSSIHGLTV